MYTNLNIKRSERNPPDLINAICHFLLLVTRSGDILRINQISRLISSTSLPFIFYPKTITTTLSIISLCYRKIRQSLYLHTSVVQLNAKNFFPCHADKDRCLTFFFSLSIRIIVRYASVHDSSNQFKAKHVMFTSITVEL